MEEEKEDLKQWADKLVELYHLSNEVCQFSNFISACNPFRRGIHIFNGIHKLAAAVGKEVVTEESGGREYPFEHYFEYRGVDFFSVSSRSDG